MIEFPIRIAVVMGKYTTGGIKSVLLNYYTYINKDKVQFDFIIDYDSPITDYSEVTKLGARVYKVAPPENLVKHISDCYRLFRKNSYQIVHGYLNTLNVFSMAAAWMAGVPVRISENLSTGHAGESKTLIKNLLRPFAQLFPTTIAANSVFAAEWIYGKKSAKKSQIFRNALDLTRFKFDESSRHNVRKRLNVDGKFVIGNVGRFQYQKNHNLLIDIFAKFHQLHPESELLLVGYGELKDQIFEKIHQLHLDDAVIDAGSTEDLIPLYNAMDCFILPSFYEGLPVVGIEAQAMSLPCVFSGEVTREVQILSTTKFVELDQPLSDWVGALESIQNVKRIDTQRELRNAGYDIFEEAKRLESFYLSELEAHTN